ncbi:MAG: hypothetical protein EOO43_15845 [Flavobacterium sp.]|nr:MAG: hypothetical protein EOO43_15845 [Flavobacterium sp.]
MQATEAAQDTKPLPNILADIKKAANVNELMAIRDYVATHRYSEGDIAEVKTALKSRHDTISH